jgi:hypothetical protein
MCAAKMGHASADGLNVLTQNNAHSIKYAVRMAHVEKTFSSAAADVLVTLTSLFDVGMVPALAL